ncbi:MAG: transcriptional repressor LexA [Candidatus Anammoxibacter sp.]
MSKKQKIHDYLISQHNEGNSPSIREICEAVGLNSPATVHKHIQDMKNSGLLSTTGKSRGIKVKKGLGIDVVGAIAAGNPIMSEDYEPEELELPPTAFAGSGEIVALRVEGNSMIDAHICDGDYAIIRKQPVVENGEIAAVTIDGEGTLKRVTTDKDGIKLKPANAHFKTIHLSHKSADEEGQQIEVFGKLVGIVRKCD